MGQVWGIGERRFGRDGEKRLFDMLDGVGIRGRNLEMDRKRKYLRVMGLENNARLYGKRGTAKREVEGKGREAGVGV